MLKKAYADGVQQALAEHGLTSEPDATGAAPAEHHSFLRKALPWLAAAGAGGLAYKGLRTPTYSKVPGLRKLQELGASKGFHRVVDVSQRAKNPDDKLVHKLLDWWRPQVDNTGKLNLANRIKLWLQEGGEAIPIASTPDGKTFHPSGAKKIDVKGVVSGRHIDPLHSEVAPRSIIRGGVDAEGNLSTQRALTHLGEAGKGFEANFMQRHAPEAFPESMTNLSKVFKGLKANTPEARIQAATELQRRLKEIHGTDQFMLKPAQGLQSAGAFPWSHQNWGKQLAKFEKHIANPANAQAYAKAQEGGLAEIAAYLDKYKIDEGRVLHEALKDPSSVLAQRAIKNPLGEYRVHGVAGGAPQSLMVARYGDPVDTLKMQGNMGKVKAKDLQAFAERTLAKLPKKYREGSYALDVMPHIGEDGNVQFKIIEMNPSERARTLGGERNPGGGSGFLDTDVMPYAGLAQYRAMTGRQATPVALAGGLGAAGLAGGLTHALSREKDEKEKQDEQPRPSSSTDA